MRFNFLRLVFIAAITAALGIKLLLWVYKPPPPVAEANVSGREAIAPAGRSVIAGTVYDEHGRPASGRSVRLMRIADAGADAESLPPPSATKSDDAGRYRFDALPKGSYLVLAAFNDLATARVFHPGAARVADASPVSITDDEARTDIDLRYRPSPTALVQGTVTRDDGAPVRLTVDLILARAPEPERVRLTTGTDDLGRFSFSDVPADEYWIVAHTQVRGTVPSDNPIGARPLVATAELISDGRTPSMVTLVARPAMTVSARLLFSDIAGAQVPERDEWSGMVRLAGRDHRSRTLLALIDTPTRSAADGSVTIHGVPAGRYALVASAAAEWKIDSASITHAARPALTLDVEDGVDLNGIQIGMVKGSGRSGK